MQCTYRRIACSMRDFYHWMRYANPCQGSHNGFGGERRLSPPTEVTEKILRSGPIIRARLSGNLRRKAKKARKILRCLHRIRKEKPHKAKIHGVDSEMTCCILSNNLKLYPAGDHLQLQMSRSSWSRLLLDWLYSNERQVQGTLL